MKRIYQILTVILAAFAITGCFEKEDLKADVAAIENVAEKSDNIRNAYNLLNQLPSLQTTEERSAAAKKVAEEAKTLKNNITALKLTSKQGKALQAQFEKSFAQLTEFANQLSQFTTVQPTAEQQQAFSKLLNEVSTGLVNASQDLQKAKESGAQQPAE